MENIITILVYKPNSASYDLRDRYNSSFVSFISIKSDQEKLIDKVAEYISKPLESYEEGYYFDIFINGVFIFGDNNYNLIGSIDNTFFIEKYNKLGHQIYESILSKIDLIIKKRKQDKIEQDKKSEEQIKQIKQIQKKQEYKQYLKLKEKFEG